MKVAIYSRKSKFTGKGESVENQVQLCKEYAIKHFNFDESSFIVYEDEGFSGGNTKRPEFQRLLKDTEANKFQMLICYRLDRISRNISDFSQMINILNKNNISFISIREQFDTTTPMGRAMMYIASVFAQLERETIAERIRDNMVQLAKTGRWLGGTTPTGYKSEPVVTLDKCGKQHRMYRLAAVPEEMDIIKLIYDRYISLKSITGIEKYLMEHNITTKNGANFHAASIRPILTNPVYAIADKTLYEYLLENNYNIYSSIDEFNGVNGLIAYNKTIQDKGCKERYRDTGDWIVAVGMHEGIIPGEKWIKAQEILKENKSMCYRKVKSNQSLLSGVLICSNCGSFMRPKAMQRKNEKGQQVFYYICEMKEKSKRKRCDVGNINGNKLDELILEEIKKIVLQNPPLFDDVPVNKNLFSIDETEWEKDTVQKKMNEIELGIQNLVLAISKSTNSEAVDVLTKNLEELTGKKEELNKKLLDIRKNESRDHGGCDLYITKESLGKFDDDAWQFMSIKDKRMMVRSVIEKVSWDGEKIIMNLY